MKFDYEVLIIGGGPAGLSSAMTLGRINRTALVCDDHRPRNAPSSHVNNFITRDGIHPAEWISLAKRDLEKYQTIKFFQGSVSQLERAGSGFTAKLSSGAVLNFKKVILAYGVQDKLPPIPGFKELWGKSIFHCAFCHGFEVRDHRLGYIASSEMAFHSLPIFNNLTSDLVLFTHGKAEFNQEQRNLLKRKNIELIEEKIKNLIYEGEHLKAVALENGQTIERQALFLAPSMPIQLKSQFGENLGCEKNQFGFYKVNERGGTTVNGVFACGDITNFAHSVLLAAASGVTAGAGAIFELLNEKLNS
jgi:thioredoxin reductase